MTGDPPEPVEAPPRREGPRPRVTVYDHGQEPALWVWTHGKWRYAVVMARHDWQDGRVVYQVSLKLPPDNGSYARTYWWPQPGLRIAHGPGDRRRPGGKRFIDST